MGYPEAQYVIDELGKNIDGVKSSMSSGVATFTSSGTFTVPDGVTKIWVTACGGGAGGNGGYHGSSEVDYGGAGGNGGSCIIREPFAVTPGESILISIGAGGAAGGVPSSSDRWGERGKSGGSTVIGSLITLPGGIASTGGSPNIKYRKKLIGSGRGGNGGYSTSGTGVSWESGEDGARGAGGNLTSDYYPSFAGGCGGGSYGNGASGADYRYVPAGEAGYGGGGGGGTGGPDSSFRLAPSAGGPGIAIIEW